MNGLAQFKTVGAWRTALGLLPVSLRGSADNQERYVLLNGSTGNFCLDFVGDIDRQSQRNAAWSCDVGHYITCADDFIVVNRWDRQTSEERYSCKSVVSQLHEFHRHLERSSPDRSQSIVAHVLRVFRQIRATINDESNGLQSLRILLQLLASAAAKEDGLINHDLGIWGLTDEIAESSRGIDEASWRPLYNDLSGIGRYEVPAPDFELVLRHAAGAVFQDAHLEAQNPSTLWLPGFELPATIDLRATPSETGIYFTPSALARTLSEEATRNVENVANGQIMLFDPACGSGELLKETLRLLKLRGYGGRVRIIGWDKSPAAVDMARFVLAWEKRSWDENQVQLELVLRDSLTDAANWPTAVDLLVMNPPFRSWQRMEPDEQEKVRAVLGASAKPNLAMAFARLGVGALREGGVLAMIAPNSLLEADSGKETREFMASNLNPQLIARLGDQSIFARALVDAGMYIGRRKPALAAAPSAILWADSSQSSLNRALRGLRTWRSSPEKEPLQGEGFSVYLSPDIATTSAPWIARGYEAWIRYVTFQHSDRMLPASELFDVKQGVRLGNDVFVVPKSYVEGLPKPERKFFRPAVMNSSIDNGRLNDAYYAFYRYTRGLPDITTEEELRRYVPQYYREYLRPAKDTLRKGKSVTTQPHLRWWDLIRPGPWQMERSPKVVSKYFGDKRSFAFDRTGDFVAVVSMAWLLKRGSVQLDATDKDVYSAILAYLSSRIAYDMLEYLSVKIGGGQLDLTNKYVGRLPVPNFSLLGLAALTALAKMGDRVSDGSVDDWSEVDELVISILSR